MLDAKITAKICEKIYEKINGKHLNLLILQQSKIYIHSQGFTNVLKIKIKIKHIMYFSRIKTHTTLGLKNNLNPDMTRFQYSEKYHSGRVLKNLTLHGMLKIDFQPDFWDRQMLSFPNMYNTMGSKVDGLAVREHFLSRNALKTAILVDTILDHLTSERTSTNNFKD